MPDISQVSAWLHATHGLLKGQSFPFSRPNLAIGRDSEADIVLDQPQVSRQHARITLEGGRWMLADLHSTNGVYLNGQRLQPGERLSLKNGDLIQIGKSASFTFEDANATLADFSGQVVPPGLWLDIVGHEVFVCQQKVEVTRQQFKLLILLYAHPGEVVSNDEIANAVWPQARGGVSPQTIDTIIHRLNRRLAELDGEHKYIVTVQGVGRKYVPRPLADSLT